MNQQYQDAVDSASNSLFIAWARLGLSTIGLLASSLGGLAVEGLIFAIVSIGIYFFLIKPKTFNELESLVVLVIVGALAVMLWPVVSAFSPIIENE